MRFLAIKNDINILLVAACSNSFYRIQRDETGKFAFTILNKLQRKLVFYFIMIVRSPSLVVT